MKIDAGQQQRLGETTPMNQSANQELRLSAGPTELSPSDRHKVLASTERRLVLDILTGWAPPIELEKLATAVAACKGDVDLTRRMALRLHHMHLPLMAEFDIIDYDPATSRVESCSHHLE